MTGSSGGGSGNGVCSAVPLPDGGGCPNGSYVSDFVDALTCDPVVGATVQALNADSVPVSGTVLTAADGTFVLCAPPGSGFTPFLSAPTYETMYFAELRGGANTNLYFIEAISTEDLGALGAFVPGGYQASQGAMFLSINTSANCPDASGWSVSLTLPDGGALADGGYFTAYLGASGFPDATLTATSAAGGAFIYDVDLTGGNYFAVAGSSPDAGACAFVLTGDGAFYTGRVYLTANSVTADTLILP